MKYKVFHFVQAPGIYHSYPQVRHFPNMSVSEYAIHFWWEGLAIGDMAGLVNYMQDLDVGSAHFGFTNMIINAPRDVAN